MPLHFPKHVPANDNKIPLSQRHWLTPEYRAKLVEKFSKRTAVQKDLVKELELIANTQKSLIKRTLSRVIR